MTTTSPTEANSNRCDPLIVEQQSDGSKRITTIFHWMHSCGIPSHTLVRIQVAPDQDGAIAIISEIFTNDAEINRYANSIGHDLDTIATSIVQILANSLTVLPERICWFGNYGEATTNTIGFTMTDGAETFIDINFLWNGEAYEDSKKRRNYMTLEEAIPVLGNLASEDIVSLLLGIGWTKLSQ